MSSEASRLGRGGRIPYQPALDGLRGIALFAMLVYHGDFSWIGGGYLSVSTFFTLSGFLITTLLLVEREGSGRIDLVEFWARRLRRLMPAALAGLALVAVYAVFAATPSQISRLPWDAAACLLYFANFRFMLSGHSYWEIFSRPSPLQHYWSLSIEEQFYLVYPLLLIAILALASRPRPSLRIVLAVLAVASSALMAGLSWAGVAPARLYYGTDTRASEFLVGALLAALLVSSGEIRPWCGRGFRAVTALATLYVVAVVCLVEQDSPFLYRGGFALYSLATAALINAALQPGLTRSFLSLPPLPWAGAISYGAYIYHWPIYLWLDSDRIGLEGVPLLALQIGLTLAAAEISYRFLERPVRVGTWLRGARPFLAAPAAAGFVAVLVLLVSVRATSSDRELVEAALPLRQEMPELGPPAPEGPVRILVLGDSIAWHIGQGFVGLAKRAGGELTVWNRSVPGCGLVRGGERPKRSEEDAARCDPWPETWEANIEAFQPDVVVILSGVWDLMDRRRPGWAEMRRPGDPEFDEWLLDEYRLAVDIASSRGAHVVWINSPCIGPVRRRNPLHGTGALDPRRLRYLNRRLLPRLVESRPTQVEIYDLFSAVCPGGRYVKDDANGQRLRNDELHIGKSASSRVAAEIVAKVLPEIGHPVPTIAPPRGPKEKQKRAKPS